MAFYEVDFMSACNPKQIKIRRTDVRTIFTEQWIKVLDFFVLFWVHKTSNSDISTWYLPHKYGWEFCSVKGQRITLLTILASRSILSRLDIAGGEKIKSAVTLNIHASLIVFW